ncbi:MAG TPA: hypothetical protein VJ420_04920 [Candidatus Udaeobacter sp.]|nr:hypothetical protein [Candidatus Udaeobacter sp.]
MRDTYTNADCHTYSYTCDNTECYTRSDSYCYAHAYIKARALTKVYPGTEVSPHARAASRALGRFSNETQHRVSSIENFYEL